MSTKPTVEAIRAEVAELLSQCPSKASSDVAVYLMSREYKFGIAAALAALTQENSDLDMSEDQDDLIDYIAKKTIAYWHCFDTATCFGDFCIQEDFEAVFGETAAVQAAKHYAEWMTTEACNLGGDAWLVRMDRLADECRVGFVRAEDRDLRPYHLHIARKFVLDDALRFPIDSQAYHYAKMLSAISGYPMG